MQTFLYYICRLSEDLPQSYFIGKYGMIDPASLLWEWDFMLHTMNGIVSDASTDKDILDYTESIMFPQPKEECCHDQHSTTGKLYSIQVFADI